MPTVSDDHLAMADRFFAAIEAGDLDAVGGIYADETVIWHNHDGVEQDKAANLRTLAWLSRTIGDVRYEEVRRIATADGFVQQHVLRGTNRSGEEVELPACMVVTVADGRITRLEEYFDSRHAERFRA